MFIQPEWPAPQKVKAYTTLRLGGASLPPYDQFNLAEHVGDSPDHVAANRLLLKKELNLKQDPIWINQSHSTIVLPALPENRDKKADATGTDQANQVCVVLTADCLPILLCHQDGTEVAAIHAGWRGLADGIIESTLNVLKAHPNEYLAWLGPAISQMNYEVGHEVYDLFISKDPKNAFAFKASSNKKWLADLYALAQLQLNKLGLTAIYGGDFCTFADKKNFYSYRRDGQQTGRMASLIWISDSP